MSTTVFLSQLQSISTTITYMNDRINAIENKINSLNVQTNVPQDNSKQDEHVRNIEKINSSKKQIDQELKDLSHQFRENKYTHEHVKSVIINVKDRATYTLSKTKLNTQTNAALSENNYSKTSIRKALVKINISLLIFLLTIFIRA